MIAYLSQLTAKLKGRPALRALIWLVAVGVIGGVFIRLFWLSYPDKQVFDEVYFPVFANKYLHRQDVFDVHPPLGKFIIALGIWLFGDAGIGWRILPLIIGIATIFLVGYLWYRYTKDALAGLIVAFFIAIDGLFIAYSRTGLMDGILFFFMFACILALLRNKEKIPMVGVATLLGLTASIKWVGLAVLIPLIYLAVRKRKVSELFFLFWWSVVVYVAAVGLGEWLDRSPDILEAIINWNQQAFHYHQTLTDTHPWASSWYTWPFLTRPVLFLYDAGKDGAVQIMTTLGNPLLWWASTASVLGSFLYLVEQRIITKKAVWEHPLILPLIGWAAAFLPWALVHRVVFLYHYMPAYGFALLTLAYWLARWFRQQPWLVIAGLTVLLIVSVYFVPFFVGWWPLSAKAVGQHLWLKSWLY